MSWHYLPELVGASSAESCSAGGVSARWKKSRTDAKCSCGGKGTVCYPCSRAGTTSAPSTADPGVASFISSLAACPAHPGAVPGGGWASRMIGTCGRRWQESLGKSRHSLFLSKTSADQGHSCGWCALTSNEWDIACRRTPLLPPPAWVRDIFDGAALYLPMLIRRDGRTFVGSQSTPSRKGGKTLGERFLPTLCAAGSGSNVGGAQGCNGPLRRPIQTLVRHAPTLVASSVRESTGKKNGRSSNGIVAQATRASSGGALNPEWAEWYMGFPIGWTALEPLAMPRYQQWLDGHGMSLQNDLV